MIKRLCFLIFIFSVIFFTLNTFDSFNVPGENDDDQDGRYDSKYEGRYNYKYITHTSLIKFKEHKICTDRNRNIIDDPQFDFM